MTEAQGVEVINLLHALLYALGVGVIGGLGLLCVIAARLLLGRS